MKKKEKYPKTKSEPISMMTPLIVGLLVFVIAHNMLGKQQTQLPAIEPAAQCAKMIENNPIKNTGFINMDVIEDAVQYNMKHMPDSPTFHLIGKNAIRLPQADVFIDLAKF